MMTPPRRCTMWGSTARHIRKTDLRSVPIMRSQSASVVSTKAFSWMMPALLTRMSMPPVKARASSSRRCTSLDWLTSAPIARATPPPAQISSTTAWAAGAWCRWFTTTRAPAWANSSAEARPMPVAAPVISAVFPCRQRLGVMPSPPRGWPPGIGLSAAQRRCWPETGTRWPARQASTSAGWPGATGSRLLPRPRFGRWPVPWR